MIDIGKPPEEPEQKPAEIGDASRFGEFGRKSVEIDKNWQKLTNLIIQTFS